jgi:hypothetical protein
MTTWRKLAPPWCLATLVVLAAGCGAASSTPTPKATAVPPVAAHHPGKPMWLQALRMTSSGTGWGLDYPANPADPSVNAQTLLARTTDGARTWADVTPAASRIALARFAARSVSALFR